MKLGPWNRSRSTGPKASHWEWLRWRKLALASGWLPWLLCPARELGRECSAESIAPCRLASSESLQAEVALLEGVPHELQSLLLVRIAIQAGTRQSRRFLGQQPPLVGGRS